MNVFWILLGIALVIIVVASIFSRKNEKKRTDSLEEEAKRLGYQLGKEKVPISPEEAKKFELLTKGSGRKFLNHLSGEFDGYPFHLFDFRYAISSGKTTAEYKQTVLLLDSSKYALPHFSMKPENFFHKFGSLLGMQDIDFDSHPAFSDQYLLQGEDEGEVRRLFTNKRLDYFSKARGWSVEGNGHILLVYRHNKRPAPTEIDGFLSETIKVAQIFVA